VNAFKIYKFSKNNSAHDIFLIPNFKYYNFLFLSSSVKLYLNNALVSAIYFKPSNVYDLKSERILV